LPLAIASDWLCRPQATSSRAAASAEVWQSTRLVGNLTTSLGVTVGRFVLGWHA
jgi:Leu/Phe-tRNA-protein transferase